MKKNQKAPEGYLTTFDFIKRTGIPYPTLYYYVLTNAINSIRIYSRIYISETEVERIRKLYYEPIDKNKERDNVSKNQIQNTR